MAGGKRKRVLVKPTASRVRAPANLPTRYNFEPRSTSQTVPPVLPKTTRQPSVLDYPPPQQLFKTGAPQSQSSPVVQPSPVVQASPMVQASSVARLTATASSANQVNNNKAPAYSGNPAATSQSSQQQQRSQASSFQPSQPSPVQATPSHPSRPTSSPHSSQAQNSAMAEEVEILSDGEAEAPIEPNLSEDQMQALNALLLAPRPKQITILDPDLIEPNSTW